MRSQNIGKVKAILLLARVGKRCKIIHKVMCPKPSVATSNGKGFGVSEGLSETLHRFLRNLPKIQKW